MKIRLDNEVFALRDNESAQLWKERPEFGRFLAVMARTVQFPEGPFSPVRKEDGMPVEMAAIIAAVIGAKSQAWHWVQLSAPTKERIGDLMFDVKCEKDRWYYLAIEDFSAVPQSLEAAERAIMRQCVSESRNGEVTQAAKKLEDK